MTKKTNDTDELNIGLRSLSFEEIEKISEECYQITESILKEYVSEYQLSNFDIIVDVDFNKELDISLDIIYNPTNRKVEKYESIIDKTLEKSFREIDKLLKERFTD